MAGDHGKAVLTVGGSTEEVATSNAGQGDKKAIRKVTGKEKKKLEENSRNEDGGEFGQGFEGKCTTMFVRKTSV